MKVHACIKSKKKGKKAVAESKKKIIKNNK